MSGNKGSDSRSAAWEPGATLDLKVMTLTILEVGDEVFRMEVAATGVVSGGPLHRHMHQTERFEVKEGEIEVRTGLRGKRLVGPGEEIVIPPGRPHTFSVEGDAARIVAEFTPGYEIAAYFK